jgi:hypothetical protein
MFYQIMVSLMVLSLIIIPIFGYFAVKNNWKIVDWF